MKICVIHGSNRKGNTDKTIEIIKNTLNESDKNISYADIFLPNDLPHFCTGCFACLISGEYGGQNCPHKEYTHPIIKSLIEADGIIFASPCYALAETGQIKAFLDHFACTYVVHRPNEEMFSKVALVVSTAAGAGTGRTVSTISRNLLFWGVKRIVKCRLNLWEMNWAKINNNRITILEKSLVKAARRFYSLTINRHKIHASFSSVILYRFAKFIVSSKAANKVDAEYWKRKGWIK